MLQACLFILLAVIPTLLQIALVYEYLFFGCNSARRHLQQRAINLLISRFVPLFALCRSIRHISMCLLQCRRISEMEFYGNVWEGVDFKRVVRSEEGACCFDLEKGRSTWTLSLQIVLFAPSPIQISRLEYFPANAHRQQLFGREWKYCLSNIGRVFLFYFSFSLSDFKREL